MASEQVDQELWHACAGVDIDIPKLNSLVYYFPRDHIEYSCSSPECALLAQYSTSWLCRVLAVSYHAESETDQVFVKFLLQHCNSDHDPNTPDPNPNPNPIRRDRISFVKVLSKSDIREGLLVTKMLGCILQKKWVDIQGNIWEFMFELKNRMFNRVTDGWFHFVKIKKLTPRDSLVFTLNKSTHECHVGIRRAVINRPISVKDIENAIHKAPDMKCFKVVYYPILGLPEFVVPKVKVDNARCIGWRREMPVSFAFELGGPNPIKWWHNGRLLNIVHRENDTGNWPDSWWRVLQVKWHVSPNILESKPNLQRNLSPWELEVWSSSVQEPAVPKTNNTSCKKKRKNKKQNN